MPVEKINWDKHDIVTCDDRGRATLGSEYANERVFVYVAELPKMSDIADEPMGDEKKHVLTRMSKWARENDIETMTHLLDPINGIVTDKSGEKHRSPYSLENQGEYDDTK